MPVYGYRDPTGPACQQAAASSIFVLPNVLCARKLVKVTDAAGRELKLDYYHMEHLATPTRARYTKHRGGVQH